MAQPCRALRQSPPMIVNPKGPPGPPCPECHSAKTVEAYNDLDETGYLCLDCEYAWMRVQFRDVRIKKNTLH